MQKNAKLSEEDYYYLPDGKMVLTKKYLLKQGKCCSNSCLNCPYEYINVKKKNENR